MKAEHLLDAMEHIEDELILEANEQPARRRFPVWQAATAAAAAVVICGGMYLWPALQPAGTAAPESQGTTNGLFEDVADTADGIVTGGSRDEYKYMTDSTMSQTQESVKGEAAPTQGVFEPVFRTEQGRYLLLGEEFPLKAELPDNARYLGELAETNYDKPVYPSTGTRELVGCAVWRSADGEYLYIQNPAGGWLQATRSK